MIAKNKKALYAPGTRVRVTHQVRIGSRKWSTEVVGVVQEESVRPIGGMEMGSKALCCHQPTLLLRLSDDELTSVALDEYSVVQVLS